MSKMSERAAIIAQLEAEGYSVTPPRDEQYIWETSVGMLLQSWHLIRSALERGDVSLSNRAYTTLGIIRREIFDAITVAKDEVANKKDAA